MPRPTGSRLVSHARLSHARLSHGEERLVKFPSGFGVAYSAAGYLMK